MSEALVTSLQSEVNRLNSELAKVRAEAKDHRIKKVHTSKALEALQGQFAGLEKDRDGWKLKAEAAPSDLQARVDELQGKLRSNTHRAAFEKVAKASNVREEAIEDLFRLTEYKPDTDEVDEAKIQALVGEAVKGRPYLLGTESAVDSASLNPGGSNGDAVRLSATAPPPGGGLGFQDKASGRFVVRNEDMRNPAWMFANQSRIAEATRAGTLVIAP